MRCTRCRRLKLKTLTLNRIQGPLFVLRVQVPHRLAHHQPEFHLIVQVRALGPQDGAGARKKNRGGGLKEEEGLFGLGVVQLGDMVPVCESVSFLFSVRGKIFRSPTYA